MASFLGKLAKGALNMFGGGPLLEAGTSILGGVLGNKHEKNLAKNSTGWAIRDTVRTAKDVGIHPLAALGTASPYQGSNPIGIGVQNAGAALNEGISRKQDRKDNAAIIASQVRVNDTQAELNAARSRTEALEHRRILNDLTATAAGPANYGGLNYYGADPLSTRPEEARIKEGPHKGKYAYMLDGVIYITGDTSPQALFEELKGSTVGELTSIADTILGSENYKGLQVIDTTKPEAKKKTKTPAGSSSRKRSR
jgi:hypothetical protein